MKITVEIPIEQIPLPDFEAVTVKQITVDVPDKDIDRIVERKKGHWIKISPANIYECSECSKNVMTDDISAYDFCHGCGARMDGEA